MGRALFEATWGGYLRQQGAAGLRPEPAAAGLRPRDHLRPRRGPAAGSAPGPPTVRDRAGDGARRLGADRRERVRAVARGFLPGIRPALDLGRRRAFRPAPTCSRSSRSRRACACARPTSAPPSTTWSALHGAVVTGNPDANRRALLAEIGFTQRDAVGVHAGSIRATAPTCGCRWRRTATRPSTSWRRRQGATSVLGLLLRNSALRIAADATNEFAGLAAGAAGERGRACRAGRVDREPAGRGGTGERHARRVQRRCDRAHRGRRRPPAPARTSTAAPSRSRTGWPTSLPIR